MPSVGKETMEIILVYPGIEYFGVSRGIIGSAREGCD
jgi:hypothetical protein